MNVWLVNPFDSLPGESYRPGRYAFLAETLAKKGHKVTWWTSNFFHFTKSFRGPVRETRPGLKIIQLLTPEYKNNIGWRRIWNHYFYARRFAQLALRSKEAPDIIIASCPPLSSAKMSIKVAKKLGAKCIIDVKDLWPEAFEMVVPQKIAKVLFYHFKKYADSIYDQADAVMAVSQTYEKRALSVCKSDKKSFVLYLGIDLNLFDRFKESNFPAKKKNGEWWATYIGTIGKSYDIKTILDVAESLESSHKSIRFFIAGAGHQLVEMQQIAAEKKLSNCMFLGFLRFEDMVGLLRQSDIGLHCIVAKSKTSLPNKVFDYMAARLPIVNSVQGELEKLLKSENFGIQYEGGDAESLKNAILELYHNPGKRKEMGENARRLTEERFDKNKTYPQLVGFLEDVVCNEKK
jgi:glycosyltransferase involved in cell wall biosynthesis